MILSLDISLTNTGYCVMEKDGNSVIEVGSFNTRKAKTRQEKLRVVGDGLSELNQRFDFSSVAIERPFSRYNKATAAIYSVIGIAQYIFWESPQFFYPPRSVKKGVAGSGNASKEELMSVVEGAFPELKMKNLDESDAVAVGIFHVSSMEADKGG